MQSCQNFQSIFPIILRIFKLVFIIKNYFQKKLKFKDISYFLFILSQEFFKKRRIIKILILISLLFLLLVSFFSFYFFIFLFLSTLCYIPLRSISNESNQTYQIKHFQDHQIKYLFFYRIFGSIFKKSNQKFFYLWNFLEA